MRIHYWLNILFLLAVSCSSATPVLTETPRPEPTSTLPEPAVNIIRPPDPEEVVRDYLEAWKKDDFSTMYSYLSAGSREALNEEDFSRHYLDMAINAAVPLGAIEYEILSTSITPRKANANYRIHLQSVHFGDIERETQMDLVLEGEEWRVNWDETMILPDLAGGKVLRRVTIPPARGEIYDRKGETLVAPADAYALGIVPAQLDQDNESGLLSLLGRVIGLAPEVVFTFYADFGPEADFYIPLTEVPAEQLDPFFNALDGYDAITITPFSGRYYFGTGIETGYVSAIQPEEVDPYTRQGFLWTERVPRAGLELWADDFLAGHRGATLYLDSPDGEISEVLSETPPGPSASVFTTLDKELQIQAQNAIRGFRGAIVVLERDTGRVLAMVSSPGFDPNLFEPTNYNALWDSPLNDSRNPLFNRAARGQYPLGSVFKVITLATALESGLFTPEDTYDCQYEFTELLPNGPILYDWTYTREDVDPSGILTLPEGLMRSCNPWFYHIGFRLFREGLEDSIPEMARGFGLGSPTGIIGLPEEETGQVPIPREALEATNLATGQGELLVTPLQVATFIAAVGNGGILYQPQLIERIEDQTGATLQAFEPQVAGTLPISPQTLSIIQDAMTTVIRNRRGTAYDVLGAFPNALAGKTGTAEVGGALDPHAWFAVYSNEVRDDMPDIAVAVVVENIGEGSEFAAPIARRVLEVYFFGRPRSLYPWEARLGVPEDILSEGEENGDSGN